MPFVSRGGEKLDHALRTFGIDPAGKICADFGSSTGGFVDCWIQHGAVKVYAVETGYGLLEWKLRNDERIVVMERTNAMHVKLPERVPFISIDTSWTKIKNVVPNAFENLTEDGSIIVLVKPHYEAGPKLLRKGKLPPEALPLVLEEAEQAAKDAGAKIIAKSPSPITGEKAGNTEYLLWLKRAACK